ncbi:MAG TPA: prepilin-type N-terminal cleavage/methylation domain-containing protein [Verrucomicrobiae bacterium]|jgi:prepilin-type N-terminal cleavage/methylation domain-containing protein
MKLTTSRIKRAFTLIEVILAIAIFAGVLAAIYACWSAVVRGSRAGLDAAAEVQRGRIAQRCFEDSLATAVLFQANARYYAFYGWTDGDFGYLSFVSRLPDSFPGAGMFGDLTMRRVSFSVERGTNNAFNLVMSQAPYLYATNADQQPYTLVLAKNVKLFQLQFYDTNTIGTLGATSGRSSGGWVDAWQWTNRFPPKIQYALALDNGKKEAGAVPYLLSGVITMPAVAVPEGNQRVPGARAPGAVNIQGGVNNP